MQDDPKHIEVRWLLVRMADTARIQAQDRKYELTRPVNQTQLDQDTAVVRTVEESKKPSYWIWQEGCRTHCESTS